MMNRTRFIALSAASVIGVTVIATAPLSAQNAVPAPHGAMQTRMVDYDDDDRRGGWGHGWREGRHQRMHQMICSDFRDDKINRVVEFIESFVDFTPPQAEAWTRLTTAVRSGSDRVGQACQDETLAQRPVTSAEKLGKAEKLLTIGLDIIKEVRPAYDEFYATLDERQKKAVDQMFRRYRHI